MIPQIKQYSCLEQVFFNLRNKLIFHYKTEKRKREDRMVFFQCLWS